MSVVSDTVDWLTDGANWSGPAGIPTRLVEHLGYTGLSVAVAAVMALPLGLWIGHTGRLRGLAVVSTGALRAVPSLGVLTLAALQSSGDLLPAVITLVVLAVPSLLAGAYAGVEAVDRRTVDAARAMGMTEWQILVRVEIPLALPLLIGGLRSAVLQVVATATIAAYIGLGGLGRYLIDGLAVSDYPRALGGSVVVVALALVLEAVLSLAQRLAARAPARV